MVAWIAFALSVIGIILNARKDIRCWPVWIVSNILWIVHTVQVEEEAAFFTWIVFLVGNGYGWYQWWSYAHGNLKPMKSNLLYTRTVKSDGVKWTVTHESTPDGFVVKTLVKSGFLPAKELDRFVSLNYNRAKRVEQEWTDKIVILSEAAKHESH